MEFVKGAMFLLGFGVGIAILVAPVLILAKVLL